MGETGSVQDDSGGKTQGSPSRRKIWILVLVVFVACAAVFLALYLFVWRGDSRSAKEKGYEKSWKSAMDEFDKRLDKDEKKAQSYLDKENLPAVIILVRERIAYLEELLDRMLDLYPPPELKRLHVATLHYLVTEIDQLKARNDLNDAVLRENPTADLTTIANNAVARSQQAFKEMSIEMQKAGVILGSEDGKAPGQKPEGQESSPTGEVEKQPAETQ